jgi:hypothetical protein
MKVVEEIVVQAIIREKNEQGQTVGEAVTNPVKVFRAKDPDVWTLIDLEVAKLELAR